MSLKKKLGSKLAQGVRQVQSQRESAPAAPTKPVVAAKPAIKLTPAQAAVKPNAPRATQSTQMNVLHPKRVWPD